MKHLYCDTFFSHITQPYIRASGVSRFLHSLIQAFLIIYHLSSVTLKTVGSMLGGISRVTLILKGYIWRWNRNYLCE